MAIGDLKRRIVAEFTAENKAKGEMAAFRRDMDTTGQAMMRMAKGAMAFVGVTGGLYGIKRGIESVIRASMEQEDAERALMAATGSRIDQYKMFAAEMQRHTIYGDELILQQMAYGVNLGITTGKLNEATKAAIGLAAKYRLDLASAMMLVGRASQGQTQMLTRYGIVLDETLTDQEKFNQLLIIGAQNFHLAEAAAKTAAGSIEQMKNAWGDIAEMVGDVALPAMQEQAESTKKFLTENQALLKRYLSDFQEGTEIMYEFWKSTHPGTMIYEGYKAATKPSPPEPQIQWPMTRREEGNALIREAKKFDQYLKQRMKAEQEAVAKGQAEQEAMLKGHWEKVSAMGGTYQEMQERMTKQRYETELQAFTQKLEEEKKFQQEWWDTVSSMGGTYQEMQERLARQRFETDLAVTTQRMEAEEEAARQVEMIWAERDRAREENEIQASQERFRAAQQLQEESAYRSKRISEDIALSMARSWTDALDRMAFEGQKFWESMKLMARSLVREIANIILYRAAAEPIATGIMEGVGKMLAGPGPLASAPVQPPGQTIFAYPGMESYQHGGIAMETGPAYIHAGERIIPAGESGQQIIEHRIINEGSEKLEISSVEEYVFSDRRIIDVTLRAMQTNVKYQTSLARAVR